MSGKNSKHKVEWLLCLFIICLLCVLEGNPVYLCFRFMLIFAFSYIVGLDLIKYKNLHE